MEFRDVQIKRIVEETHDTKTFYFAKNIEAFRNYLPGQYITVRLGENGETRRSYSLCTAPFEDEVGFTVKRVKGGKVSGYLHDTIKPGEPLSISEPEGRFVVEPDHHLNRDHYFFAAGSGITPVMSMIYALLELEPQSTLYLLYGSRSERDIIFREKWDALLKKHEGQLYIEYTLSRPKEQRVVGFSGFLGKKKMDWTGKKGRINPSLVEEFLLKHPSRSGVALYYICGPGDMITHTEEHLKRRGVMPSSILKEYFTTPEQAGSNGEGVAAECNVTIHGSKYKVEVLPTETVLESMIRNKLDPPYSCTSGACSSCLARKLGGIIEMDACYALDDDEVKEGYILTCQSRILSETAEITYDV